MKKKLTFGLLPLLTAPLAFAATYTSQVGSETAKNFSSGYTADLAASVGANGETSGVAKFDTNARKDLYYIFAAHSSSTALDASFEVSGGGTLIRDNSSNYIIGLRTNTEGRDSTLTLKDGVYNLGMKKKSDGSYTTDTAVGFVIYKSGADTTAETDTRGIILDSSATINTYSKAFSVHLGTNTSAVFKGTLNVYNQAISGATYPIETPENPTYGAFTLMTSASEKGDGKVIVDGGTFNVSDITVNAEKSKFSVINAGTVNMHGDATTITAQDFTVGDSNASTQEKLNASGVLTINAAKFTATAGSSINAGNININVANFTSAAGSSINAGNISVSTTDSNIAGNISSTGVLTVEVGKNLTSTGSVSMSSFVAGENSVTSFGGAVSTSATKTGATVKDNVFALYNNSTVIFEEGASLTQNRTARIALGKDATLIVKSGEESLQARYILLSAGSRVELHSKNAIVDTKAGSFTSLLTIVGTTSATLYVADTNVFANTAVATPSNGKNTSITLELDFSNPDSYIDLGRIYGTSTKTAYSLDLYVKNFENNRIKASKIEDSIGYINLIIYDESQNDYVFAENAKWIGNETDGYWLTWSAAVPEPAEWAAIFGAVALGLAIYRRRK